MEEPKSTQYSSMPATQLPSTAEPVQTEGKRNWTPDEDTLLLEALEKFNKNKTGPIKVRMETAGKVVRSEVPCIQNYSKIFRKKLPTESKIS